MENEYEPYYQQVLDEELATPHTHHTHTRPQIMTNIRETDDDESTFQGVNNIKGRQSITEVSDPQEL